MSSASKGRRGANLRYQRGGNKMIDSKSALFNYRSNNNNDDLR